MQISIVIPCYNEEKRITETVKKIDGYVVRKGINVELIFINDGSTDKTKKMLDNFKEQFANNKTVAIKIVSYRKNYGKGYAIKQGIVQATGKYILLCDADLSTPITELDKLMYYVNDYDLIVGSRKSNNSKILRPQSFFRTLSGKTYSFMSRVILNVPLNDFTCGFKLIKNNVAKKIVKKMSINRWAYDSELLKIAATHNFKIKEIGIIWQNDPDTKVELSTDIITSLKDLIKIRIYSFFKKYD